MTAEVQPLSVEHDTASFTCGKPALDTWLRNRALRNQETGDSRTYVLCENRSVIAYYALSTASAVRTSLSGPLRRNAPDPVPLMLLGQLAVASSHHRKGLGSLLLRDALIRVANASRHVGFRALVTHPIDEEAHAFYVRYGFSEVPDSQPRLMVMPLQRLLAAAAAAR